MKHAIIAIEDRRFYTNDGVDLRGIGRALSGRRRQAGGPGRLDDHRSSSSRTRSPPRTSARCSRSCARPRWPTTSRASGPRSGSCATTSTRSTSATAPTASSRPPAPTSAATTRAASSRPARGPAPPSSSRTRRRCSPAWSPRRARYDPIAAPGRRQAAPRRSCSRACSSRATSRASSTTRAIAEPLPDARATIQPPREDTEYPYFTSWIKQQVVDQLGGGQTGARQAFEGGLTVKTTIDARSRRPPTTRSTHWLP